MLLQSRPLESKARREIEQCHTLTFAALRTGHHGLLASRFTFHGHCHGASCLAESRIFATAHSRASLPICISMLQRSSKIFRKFESVQGDPRGSPWGSKGLVFQYFRPRLIRLDMSLTGLEFRAAVVLVSAGPALTAFAAQQWRLHTVGGSWQEQG